MLEKIIKAALILSSLGLICGRIMINHGVNHQDVIMLERGIMLNLWLLLPTLCLAVLVLSIDPPPTPHPINHD